MKKLLTKINNYLTDERLRKIFIIELVVIVILCVACIVKVNKQNTKLAYELASTEELCDSLYMNIDALQIELSEMRHDNWEQVSELEKRLTAVETELEALKAAEKTEKKETSTVKKEETKKNSAGTYTANITHYCACSKCNGSYSWSKDGVNYSASASGLTLHDGLTGNYCAATFGSLGDVITIKGVDYKIVDRMGGNSGYRIDIFVGEGHAKCMELGRYTAEVTLKK